MRDFEESLKPRQTVPLGTLTDTGLTPCPKKRLYLINPSNPKVAILDVNKSHWNRYRVWKPVGLMVIAGLIPENWDVTILDENLGEPDYRHLPRPDLVGITSRQAVAEMLSCYKRFYSIPRIARRLWKNLWRGQSLSIGLAGGMSYKRNISIDRANLEAFLSQCGSDIEALDERNIETVTNHVLRNCES